MKPPPTEIARCDDMAAYLVNGNLVVYWADSDGTRGARVCWELGVDDVILLPPPKPKPSPPRNVNWLGAPIDKPMPRWRVELICWGFAILVMACFIIAGLIIHLEIR